MMFQPVLSTDAGGGWVGVFSAMHLAPNLRQFAERQKCIIVGITKKNGYRSFLPSWNSRVVLYVLFFSCNSDGVVGWVEEADTVVIGGGAVGTSIAYHMAKGQQARKMYYYIQCYSRTSIYSELQHYSEFL